MDAARFKRSKGQIRIAKEGYPYFVPPPIPRELEYDSSIVDLLARAQLQLGRLSSFGDLIPNPQLLIAPYLRREAVLSSRIEGTQASIRDVFKNEAKLEHPADVADMREVRNYVTASEKGVQAIAARPLDLDLLRELHGILLHTVRGSDRHPGQFRRIQNWIGPPGCTAQSALFVPPEPGIMKERLADLDAFLIGPPQIPDVLQAALLHYQFEAIHPFEDGNGRIGRLLVMLLLIKRRALSAPLLYLSAYFEANRQDYYKALLRVSTEGAYDDWFRFFLEGVATQAADAFTRAKRLIHLRESYRKKLQGMHATVSTLIILDQLFVNPFTSITGAADRLGVVYPTAQKAIEEYLVPAEILMEVTRQKRYRVWVAREILTTLE